MKSKVLSFVFCFVAFALSMVLMLQIVNPSGLEPKPQTGEYIPTETGNHLPPITTGSPDTGINTGSMTLSDVAETGKAAVAAIDRLAYSDNKEYANSLGKLVTQLRAASAYLSEKASDMDGSLYYAALADLFDEILSKPFTDNSNFSSNVSAYLKRLDSIYPADAANSAASAELAEGQTRMYYPKFDTDVNGAFVLAMLSLYEKQAVQNPNVITISVGGNVVLGDSISTSDEKSFANQIKKYGNNFNYPFFRVSPLFATDSLSLISLENPLTSSINLSDGVNAVKGYPEYVDMLKKGSVEAATFSSEHAKDYGDNGYTDTITAFANAGIALSIQSEIKYIDNSAGKIALITYNIIDQKEDFVDIPKDDIAKAKANGAALVIVSFHWVNSNTGKDEYSSDIAGIQARSARKAIDNGAALVIGSHPHIMQAVEKYNGKSIIYSPGDLSYAATLDTTKASKETFIFRQSFTIENGNATPSAMNVFPVINTSSDSENDFLPTPVFDSRAETIINNLVTYSTASKYGIKKTDINYIVITKQ